MNRNLTAEPSLGPSRLMLACGCKGPSFQAAAYKPLAGMEDAATVSPRGEVAAGHGFGRSVTAPRRFLLTDKLFVSDLPRSDTSVKNWMFGSNSERIFSNLPTQDSPEKSGLGFTKRAFFTLSGHLLSRRIRIALTLAVMFRAGRTNTAAAIQEPGRLIIWHPSPWADYARCLTSCGRNRYRLGLVKPCAERRSKRRASSEVELCSKRTASPSRGNAVCNRHQTEPN